MKVLLEHSIYLRHYNAVVTLLWIEGFLAETVRAEEAEDPYLDDLDPEEFTIHRKNWPHK